jgi:hypothetical protein
MILSGQHCGGGIVPNRFYVDIEFLENGPRTNACLVRSFIFYFNFIFFPFPNLLPLLSSPSLGQLYGTMLHG